MDCLKTIFLLLHISLVAEQFFTDDISIFFLPFLFFQDVSASLSVKYPELYREGIKNVFFKWRVVAIWAFFSVFQSLILYYFVSTSSLTAKNSAGLTYGVWDVSTLAFTCIIITVNLRLLMICNSITKWHSISVGGSILAWFIFAFIYSAIIGKVNKFSSPLFTSHCFAFWYGKITAILYV